MLPCSELKGEVMKPIEAYGYDSVGNGWRTILEALDDIFVWFIEDDGDLKIAQIKEKFGGLRVYVDTIEPSHGQIIHGAIMMAEAMASRICERCGSTSGVERRGVKDVPSSWILTLCDTCHSMRDSHFPNWPVPDPIPATELNIGETK
jgi:hypothetical protein